MNDSTNTALDTLSHVLKGAWQAIVIPVGITAWAIYRDVVSRRSRRRGQEQASRRQRGADQDQKPPSPDLSVRHHDYIRRIEQDFQEIYKQLQDTEAEATLLRREKWAAELAVRSWRHNCRDAQQIVWALQRQGCPAGTELTQFKPIEAAPPPGISPLAPPPGT